MLNKVLSLPSLNLANHLPTHYYPRIRFIFKFFTSANYTIFAQFKKSFKKVTDDKPVGYIRNLLQKPAEYAGNYMINLHDKTCILYKKPT